MRLLKVVSAIIFMFLIGTVLFLGLKQRQQPTNSGTSVTSSQVSETATNQPEIKKEQTYKTLKTQGITGISGNFQFTSEIPDSWQVEAIPTIDAINIFDPNATGTNNLEKSQIFIRNFKANSFLTLSTVTIHSRTEVVINGPPAIRYDIEK